MAQAPVSPALLTAEQFFALPEPEHGGKMELVRGAIVVHMPVSGGHGITAGILDRRVGGFVDVRAIGVLGPEIGFLLSRDPDVVRAPDVAYVSRERPPHGLPADGFVPFPPTTAIEVASSNDRDTDIQEKVDDYLAAGVQRVWVVRPRTRSVTVYRIDGTARIFRNGDVLTSDDAAFSESGFELPVAALWPEQTAQPADPAATAEEP